MKLAARLLLLVALLLPLRGVLGAGGLLCHSGAPVSPMSTHAGDAGGLAGAMSGDGHREHVHHGHGADDPANRHVASGVGAGAADGAGPPAGASTCDLCSSVCASPALPSGTLQLAALLPAAGERFPTIHPPRANPTLGGVERPPRSV